MPQLSNIFYISVLAIILSGCQKEIAVNPSSYLPVPLTINIPSNFPPITHPEDNPLTEEGVELGRHLFWETKLSGDNNMSCATCHSPQNAFSEPYNVSVGINGDSGTRNAMVLQNLAWSNDFFWDGRSSSLEEQILIPVLDSTEMDETWANFLSEIKYDNKYRELFFDAFGILNPDSTHAAKALAQFVRTMVSTNSKFDKFLRQELALSQEESAGYASFNSLNGGDCFHCHGGILGTDNSYKNNGLDEFPIDTGRGLVTNLESDYFKFKVPSIRNVEYSAPYMHDGRFSNLDEVINFYSTGIHSNSPNIDPLIEFASQGGVQLSPQERTELKAFLLTLSDPDFINNPKFSNPF
jgi:cytochrome c peroxidase